MADDIFGGLLQRDALRGPAYLVNNSSVLIDIRQLRVGMYIQLDVGWLRHPFPTSSFKLTSADQIHQLRSLGVPQIRYVPAKSDPSEDELVRQIDAQRRDGSPVPAPSSPMEPPLSGEAPVALTGISALRARRLAALALVNAQRVAVERCDQRFSEVTRGYQQLMAKLPSDPREARSLADSLVGSRVAEVLDNRDSAIQLLSQGVGVQPEMHSVNVMVLSLLLGRALGLQRDDLLDIGKAALLHDVGKHALPLHVAEPGTPLSPPDLQRYRSHVAESVNAVRRMGLPGAVQVAIAQHHEMADGSGFPLGLRAEDLSRAGQIVALVNHYERACNPLHGAPALTPHEALSVIYAQHKMRFDAVVLGAFIRMMGVYPPGSVVQLANDRYALVMSVNSSRPLRPRVLVHDPHVPKDEAVVIDLETLPELGIRRSLRPSQLPRDALDYLAPRQRICYFFERAAEPSSGEAAP